MTKLASEQANNVRQRKTRADAIKEDTQVS